MPYNPDEPRDNYGRWTGGGTSGAGNGGAGTTLRTEVPPEGSQRNPPFAYRAAPPPPPRRSYAETFYPTMRRDPNLVDVADRRQQVDPVTAKKQAWIDAHYAEAKEIADRLGITPEQVLALAAAETGYGTGRFAREGNNFFSIHGSGPLGKIPATRSVKGVNVAKFGSFRESAEAFERNYGHLIAGVKDPAEFARRLQDAGIYGINEDGTKVPHFVGDVASIAKGLRAFKPRR